MKKRMISAWAVCALLAGMVWSAEIRPSAYVLAQETAEPEGAAGSETVAAGNPAEASASGGDAARKEITGEAIEETLQSRITGTITDVLTGHGQKEAAPEPEPAADDMPADESGEEYANLAIANVDNYVNVRSIPSTDGAITGKIYNGSVGQILSTAGEEGDWFQVISGSVEGYIKAEYFLYGEAAAAVLENYVTYYAQVLADRLNVRREPSTDSGRIGYIDLGERVKVLENLGDWLRIQYTEGEDGYVSAEYVQLSEEFIYAVSIEEEQAQLAARAVLEERRQVPEQSAPEAVTNIVFPDTVYSSNEDLRKAIVDYAMQYEGGAYVHGGRSLSGGTDCSGFTCFVYADFGYAISRTPSGQYSSAGRSISYDQIQPGDIICYSSNKTSCTHVGLYIGDGQIIHAANSRKGIIVQNADYDTIIGIRNVID